MKRRLMISALVLGLVALTIMWADPSRGEEQLPAPILVSQEKINCEQPAIRCDGVTAIFDIPNTSIPTSRLYLKVGSQAAPVSPGQTGVEIPMLGFDRIYSAVLVYDIAQGCCWITQQGASTSFRTVSISGILIEPSPTPTPTPTTIPTPIPTPSFTTQSETSTVTTSETNTVTATQSESSSAVSSPTPSPTTTTASSSTSTTNVNAIITLIQSLLAQITALLGALGVKL